jgi:hypothetical protein
MGKRGDYPITPLRISKCQRAPRLCRLLYHLCRACYYAVFLIIAHRSWHVSCLWPHLLPLGNNMGYTMTPVVHQVCHTMREHSVHYGPAASPWGPEMSAVRKDCPRWVWGLLGMVRCLKGKILVGQTRMPSQGVEPWVMGAGGALHAHPTVAPW